MPGCSKLDRAPKDSVACVDILHSGINQATLPDSSGTDIHRLPAGNSGFQILYRIIYMSLKSYGPKRKDDTMYRMAYTHAFTCWSRVGLGGQNVLLSDL